MSGFESFVETHGPGIDCRKARAEDVRRYRDRLPSSLLDQWKAEGRCGYAEGLIWIIDPGELEDALEEWLESSEDTSIAFARSAFGDMFLWSAGEIYFLDVQRATTKFITGDIEVLFDSVLTDDEVLDTLLRRPIFREALPRLGAPDHTECYAFVPALALGGPGTAESLQKVKLREHLSFLAQVAGA